MELISNNRIEVVNNLPKYPVFQTGRPYGIFDLSVILDVINLHDGRTESEFY